MSIAILDDEKLQKLFYFSLKKTGSPYEAEELVQETALEMIKMLNRGYEPDNFNAWMWTVARKRYARWCKSKQIRLSRYTVEEYVSFGNCFYVYDYSPEESEKYKRHYFKTTGELTQILNDFKNTIFRDIKLQDNRTVYRPKTKRTPKKILRAMDLSEYYVLKGEYNGNKIYFINLNRKGGFQYLSYFAGRLIKVFKTEKDALAYLRKYKWVLERYNFLPEKIVDNVLSGFKGIEGGAANV